MYLLLIARFYDFELINQISSKFLFFVDSVTVKYLLTDSAPKRATPIQSISKCILKGDSAVYRELHVFFVLRPVQNCIAIAEHFLKDVSIESWSHIRKRHLREFVDQIFIQVERVVVG